MLFAEVIRTPEGGADASFLELSGIASEALLSPRFKTGFRRAQGWSLAMTLSLNREGASKLELVHKENQPEELLNEDRALLQEVFFFCTIKNLGDIPGTGCIYVETVVDRDTGMAFAKVYSAKHPINAVDILASRVVPFFERRGQTIKEIHTRRTNEYCGLLPVHPYESFLATSHIQHLPKSQPGHPDNHLCEEFYRFLLKEFFLPALRRKFQITLDSLQKDLDIFVQAYNKARMNIGPRPSSSREFPCASVI